MWRRLTLSLSSVYLSRSVRLQNSKLASLQLLLLLFLITFVLFKALQGALYEQLRAEHWIIGDLQALTRPREGLQNDTEMQEPICPKLVNELLQTLELRHVKRVAQWVDDQGIAILTKSYLSDFCAVQPRFLGRFMYGSQVAGFLVGTVDETLALMAKAQLDSGYTLWKSVAPEKVTASFFEQPSKTWWGQGFTWQSHAEGYFVLRHGELRLVLSTGQVLPASFAASTLSVQGRDGRVLRADFVSGALAWRGATPVALGNATWRPLPEITSGGAGEVVAVGLESFGRREVKAFLEVLEVLPPVKNISMVYRTMGGLPCLQQPLGAMSKDLGRDETLIVTAQEHYANTAPRMPAQLGAPSLPERRYMGGHMDLDADRSVVRIGFSRLSRQGNITGTLAACALASDDCTDVMEAQVESTSWEGQHQESILIPVATLLDMQRLRLDSCAHSAACALLLVVKFSNRLDWSWLRPLYSDDFGTLTFQVRVYKTSMAGSISDFSDVMDSGSNCIHEVRHAGVRLRLRFEGVLHRWSSFSFFMGAGSLAGLFSIADTIVALCTIGFLGKYCLGDRSVLYKAHVVHNVVDQKEQDDLNLARRHVQSQAATTLVKLDQQQADELLGIAEEESDESSDGFT